MRRLTVSCLAAATIMLSGCIGTLVDVATAPVKVLGKGVDLMTTSQSEADENRGRELRKREARLGKLRRDYEDQLDECEEGDARACADARDTYAEMQVLIRSLPAEPEG